MEGGIGTLAVLSPKPNQFTEQHASILGVLARQVMMRLEYSVHSKGQDHSLRSRQRIERALTVERNFVSAVLDTMSALVLVVDTAGRIVRFNRACEEISGYTFAELAGRSFPQELFLTEERSQAFDLIEQSRREARREPTELHWLSRDGRRRRIAWNTTTLTDGLGDINFIIMTGVDVTDQREATAALHASEARYRQLVESSLGMVCTHDLEGKILSINTNAAESLGYRSEEMVGKQLIDFVPEDQKETFQNYLQSIARSGEEQGMLSLRHRNGQVRFIAWRNRLLELPETPPFVLGHGIDVTEKTDAENKLHAVMRQRESILESVGDGIYGVDMEGQIIFVNDVGARMMGYTQEEMEGKELLQMLGHARADGSVFRIEDSPIYAARRSSAPIRARDEVFRHKDGHPVPVEYVACPMLSNGRVTGVVVAFQDVTERRRLDRMKDEFISTVSHELRTPLTALRAALGLIAGGALEKRPEKRAQMMDVAIGNCDRLVRLVNDILDFERMGAGRLPMRFQEVEAKDLLRRATDLQHPSAQKAGIQFPDRCGTADAVGGRGPHPADAGQPDQQRDQVFAGGQRDHAAGADTERNRGDYLGLGPRPRGSTGEAGDHLRALPAGGRVGFARDGGNRTGTGHLPQHRAATWRTHLGGKHRGQGKHVLLHSATNLGAPGAGRAYGSGFGSVSGWIAPAVGGRMGVATGRGPAAGCGVI
jgi:two-component system, OmpR family, sensor histidine kinase VicK